MFAKPHTSQSPSRCGVPVEAPDLVGIDVQRRVLDNGIICFTATGPNVKRFFGASVFTPARSSNGEQHVLEHMIMSGSQKFPDPNIYAQTHATSDSSPGACTYHNRTWYYGSSLSDAGLKATTSILLDGMFNPLLSEESFKAESFRLISERNRRNSVSTYPAGVVFNEMRQSYLHPANVALRNAVAHLFPEALAQIDFAGSPEGLKRLRHKDILRYHERFYYPENGVYFISHPTSPAPFIRMLESLKPTDREHHFQQPTFDPSLNARAVHVQHPVDPAITGFNSTLVLLYPTEKPSSMKELLFHNMLWDALFYLDRNGYRQKFSKVSLEGRSAVSSVSPMALGGQFFVVVQVQEMAPTDRERVQDLVMNTYRTVTNRNLPLRTFQSALAGLRHYYSLPSGGAEEVFWNLTEDIDTYPQLNLLTRRAVAQDLLHRSGEVYPEFCRFVERLFSRDPLVFSQDPVAAKGKSKSSNPGSNATEEISAPAAALPVVVPEYDLITRKVATSAADDFKVRLPFGAEGYDRIVSIPVGDQNRVHLNIGFDLSVLPSDVWMHAIFILNTIAENRSHFKNSSHMALKLSSLASTSTNQVFPLAKDGCHFFMGVSVFPEHLEQFLESLGKIFANPDYTKASYLHGLYYQRDSLFPDIYDPSASDGLSDAFMTRALAYCDSGYRHREALVGFSALPRFNKILRANDKNQFSESERRTYRAVNYIFSSSGLQLHYSAPEDREDEVARALRKFFDAQRRYETQLIYPPTIQLARNEYLIAPSVTNIAARVLTVPEFGPEYEPALAMIKGFYVSNQLTAQRGFYRNYSKYDITNGTVCFMSQRGSSPGAPFKVWDGIPGVLRSANLSRRQTKGLQMGALKGHLARLTDSDPHSTMLRRARLHTTGWGPARFQEYAEGILAGTGSHVKWFGELVAERQKRARNVVLTSEAGAQELRSQMKRIAWGKPTSVHL